MRGLGANPWQGLCYHAANVALTKEYCEKPNARLVHGVVQGRGPLRGKRIGHAWVEWDEPIPITGHPGMAIRMAFDATAGESGTELPAEYYRQLARVSAKQIREYTCEEATLFALKCGHWGPWRTRDKARTHSRVWP